MKRCPKCKRTYADDAFTFCLEDGALLSAPYDPEKKEEPISTIQSGGPPPTAVLPKKETLEPALPPTAMNVRSQTDTQAAKSQVADHSDSLNSRSPTRRKVVITLVAAVIVVAGLGFVSLYLATRSNCPNLVIQCSPANPTTYCDLAEETARSFNGVGDQPISEALTSRSVILLQAPLLPKSITSVSWSASSGRLTTNHSQLLLDATGLAGQTITVNANVRSTAWFCSTTVSTSFVVPKN
jgi:hypothetical protein